MSIGWMGCDLTEALLFMPCVRAIGWPEASETDHAIAPTRSRMALNVDEAPSNGRLLM